MKQIIPQKFKDIIRPEEEEIFELNSLDKNYRLRDILMYLGKDFYNESDTFLRDAGFNGGFPLHMNKHVDLNDDIFYLKLYRKGLVDIKLHHIEVDVNTEIGKEFFKFLQNYKLYSNLSETRYVDSELGHNEYDIKKIIEESYEELIWFLYNSIDIEEDEITGDNVEYIFEDRMAMEVTISNGKDFLKGLSKELYEGNLEDSIKIIKELFNPEGIALSREIIELDVLYADFLKNPYILLVMEYLNISGKIILENVSVVSDFEKKGLFMRFFYKPNIRKLEDIFLDDFPDYLNGRLEHKINGDISDFKEGALYINGTEIPGNPSMTTELISIIYKLKKSGQGVNYKDIRNEVENSGKDSYRKLKERDFTYDSKKIKDTLSPKNKQIKEDEKLKGLIEEDFFVTDYYSVDILF